MLARTTDTRPDEGINQRNLKIWALWEWEWIFGPAAIAISLPGVRSP